MLVFPLCPAPWKKQVAPAARPTPCKKSNFWIALWIFTFVPPHGFFILARCTYYICKHCKIFWHFYLVGEFQKLKGFKMALFVLPLCVLSILLKFWYWHWNLYLFDTVEASAIMVYFTFKRLNTRIENKRIPCISRVAHGGKLWLTRQLWHCWSMANGPRCNPILPSSSENKIKDSISVVSSVILYGWH